MPPPPPSSCRCSSWEPANAGKMSTFNKSLSNRLFAAFLSMLLMIPTGWGLFTYWTHDFSTDEQDWLLRIFVHAGMDAVAVAFWFSVLGLLWAVFAPRWIGRLFGLAQDHFVKALAIFLCVVLAMLAFAFATLLRVLRVLRGEESAFALNPPVTALSSLR